VGLHRLSLNWQELSLVQNFKTIAMSYVPNTEHDRIEMLKKIGVESFEDLIRGIPDSVRLKEELKLPQPLSELELSKLLSDLSRGNKDTSGIISFLGGGAYDHFIPAVVDHIISRSEFYTAYTPYQAEVSQGTLQTIYEFQSLICELTGMDVANASMYDGATAVAEAALLAHAETGRNQILAAGSLNPSYKEVLSTYCRSLRLKVKTLSLHEGLVDPEAVEKSLSEEVACVILQSPNFFGSIENVDQIEPLTHSVGALLILAGDPISLGILKTPGEYNADIAVGEGQAMGNYPSFGGPYLGYFACKRNLIRRMPGRIVGATTDTEGKRGFVLTLQTREQHIRREKATSNICTNQALCALASCVYLSLLGKSGIKKVAELCLQKSHYACDQITKIEGFKKRFGAPFFKEFVVETPLPPKRMIRSLVKRNLFAGIDLAQFDRKLKNCLLVCVTEKRTREEIDHLVNELRKAV
jgi:glycine dehydrogenase subunit 1